LGILQNPLLKQTFEPVLNITHSNIVRWPGGSIVGAGSDMLEEKAEGEEGSKPPLQVCKLDYFLKLFMNYRSISVVLRNHICSFGAYDGDRKKNHKLAQE
jgi:hypothetical protein